MSTIDDLKRSISEMTTEELMDAINQMRQARRSRVVTPKKGASSKSPIININTMTAEEADQLLKLLQGG